MGKIWVTSDLHLFHKNILNLEKDSLKNNNLSHIKTLEEYNEMIIKRINSRVKQEDTLYILGDFCFGGTDKVKEVLPKIKGHKILIVGNHDKLTKTQYLSLGFDDVKKGAYYLPESNGKIVMSHYPLLDAYNNPYISYCLHGHLHGSKLDLDNFMNVNIALNNYYPIDLDRLLKKTSKDRFEKFGKEWYFYYQVFFNKNRTDLKLDLSGKVIEMIGKEGEEEK